MNNKIFIISFILIFCFEIPVLFSQNKTKIDSLMKLLEAVENDTAKADIYYQLADLNLYSDKDTSEFYTDAALSLSLKNNYILGIANSYLIMAKKHNLEGNYKESVDYVHKAINIYLNKDYTEGVINSYSLLGLTNYYLGDNEKAFEHLRQALKLSEEIGKRDTQKIYNNLGLLYLNSNNNDSALFYFEKSILISTESNDNIGIVYSYGNIANIYLSEKNYDKALLIFQKVEKLCKELNDKNGLSLSYSNTAVVYDELAEEATDKSEKEKYLKMAAEYSKKALKISGEINSLPQINFINYQLAFIFKKLNNYEQAFKYAEDYITISDSLYDINKVKEIEFLQKKFKTEQQKLKIENITKESELNEAFIKKQNQIIILGTIAIFIVMVLLVILFILYKNKRSANILLNEKNEAIKNQRSEIVSQRDNLSELAFELKKINKTKDKYFSVLAHDLKNPFQSILGFSELLKTDIKAKDYSKIGTYADFIFDTGKKTYALLENLLDWARLQRGALKYQPEQYNLLLLINETVEIIKSTANSKGINIKVEVQADEEIYVDKYMFSTIIRNLISNAIKYTKKEGEITVKSEPSEKGKINVSVADNGVGIKEENLARIFKLDQGRTSRGTENEKGTGLGLIVCKEFTEKNHGIIAVESEFGKGSKFTLTFPVNADY